jgi:hypothetical protein
MTSAHDAIAIAREMIAAHGERAAAIAEERRAEHVRAGEAEGAALWGQVGRAVRELQSR